MTTLKSPNEKNTTTLLFCSMLSFKVHIGARRSTTSNASVELWSPALTQLSVLHRRSPKVPEIMVVGEHKWCVSFSGKSVLYDKRLPKTYDRCNSCVYHNISSKYIITMPIEKVDKIL
jgi:hypothetical protein